MQRKTMAIAVVVALAALAGAYLAGQWFERGKRVAAEAQVARLENRLGDAETRLRVAEILGRVLTVKELAMRQDYGLATERSTALFDSIRQETMQIADGVLRDSLRGALNRRDAVIAALARGEPAAVDLLHAVELQLRGALGYDLAPTSKP